MAEKQLAQFVFIEAQPERVWRALVESNEIVSWLAESCDVDLDAGRYTLVAVTPGVTGEHRVAGFASGEWLRLAWVMGEQTSTLEFRLAPHDGGTRLVTHHTFDPERSPVNEGHVHELWAYNNSLLKTWIELGDAKCRLASDRLPAHEIRHAMTLAAPASRVFAALTEPDEIRQWNAWAKDGTVCDGTVGGRYSFGWESEAKGTDGPATIVEWEEGRKLTYRWHGDPPTLVSFEIEPMAGSESSTRLTLVHSGFGVDQNMLVDYNLGWADFLANIAIYVERGVAAGWSGVAQGSWGVSSTVEGLGRECQPYS
ncbi:MAG: SRPBCC family protein [Myxococcota bacterium]